VLPLDEMQTRKELIETVVVVQVITSSSSKRNRCRPAAKVDRALVGALMREKQNLES
jgi:hypothetical protein